MIVYRIPNWSEKFENHKSRILKELLYVPMPNNHDGDAFSEIMEHPHGEAIYGCWALICQVASKCSTRGELIKENGQPHDAQSLARKTRSRAAIMQMALDHLVQVGWLSGGQDGIVLASSGGNAAVSGANPALIRRYPAHDTALGAAFSGDKGRKEGIEEKEEKERTTTLSAVADVCEDSQKCARRTSHAGDAVNQPEQPAPGVVALVAEPAGEIQQSVASEPVQSAKPASSTSPTSTRTSGTPTVSDKPIVYDLEQLAGQVYQHYPKKVGRPQSIKYITARLKTFITYDARSRERDRLIEHVQKYAASDRVRSGYVMDASTFFNTHMEDDPGGWTTQETGPPKNPSRPKLATVQELIANGTIPGDQFGVDAIGNGGVQ